MLRWLVFVTLLTVNAVAAVDDEPPLPVGTVIQIESWDERTHTYNVINTVYPAQGPNYALLKDLAVAVNGLDIPRATRKPATFVGNEYKLDAPLKLQSVVRTLRARKRAR